MYDYNPKIGRWKKLKRGKPATGKQQQLLVALGWGKDNLTTRGAWHIIDAIINEGKEHGKRIQNSNKQVQQMRL